MVLNRRFLLESYSIWWDIEGFVFVVDGHSRLVVRYRRIMVGNRRFRRLLFGKRKLAFGNRMFGKLYFIIGFSRSVQGVPKNMGIQ